MPAVLSTMRHQVELMPPPRHHGGTTLGMGVWTNSETGEVFPASAFMNRTGMGADRGPFRTENARPMQAEYTDAVRYMDFGPQHGVGFLCSYVPPVTKPDEPVFFFINHAPMAGKQVVIQRKQLKIQEGHSFSVWTRKCAECGIEQVRQEDQYNFKVCSCRQVHYCCHDCQWVHWPVHKLVCTAVDSTSSK